MFDPVNIPFGWDLKTNKHLQDSQDRVIAALKFSGAVEFGSRALGVHRERSDYDFAILESTYLKLFPNCDIVRIPISEYFKISPGYGQNYLKKHSLVDNIDIIVLEHQEHLDIVRKAVEELKTLPTYFLEDRSLRISLYEKSLEARGFIHKNATLSF